MHIVNINLAQNDDQGRVTNYVSRIDFSFAGECFAEIIPKPNFKERLTTNEDRILMYGYLIKTRARQEWAGNMMYNMYPTRMSYALGFLNMLQLSKRWSIQSGYTDLFTKFEKGGVITSADILDKGSRVIEPLILNTRAHMEFLNPKIAFEFPTIQNLPGEQVDNPNQIKLPL